MSAKNNQPSKSTKSKEVAVIGGGFTGLTAAYRLSQKGYKVTVYERAPVLGGLVAGFTLKNGAHLERAYHFLYKTDKYILNLCEELGIRDKLHFHDSSIGQFYQGKLYPFMTPLDLIRFSPLNIFQRVRTGVVALYLQNVKNWEKLTQVTAMEWLTKWNGKKATRILWEPLLRGKFDRYYDKITMSWLWGRIKVRQDSREKGDTGEKLGYFENGWQEFTDSLIAGIKANGGILKPSSAIEAITHDKKQNKVGVTVDGKTTYFDSCIATVPSPVFSKLSAGNKEITQAYQQKLSSIDYLGAVLMVFTSKQKLSDYYWHQINDLDAPYLVLLDLTNLTQNTKPYDGKHVYYIGDYVPMEHELFSLSDEELKQRWFAGTKKLFPNFDQSQIDELHIFKFKDAQHIVNVGYEKKIPDYRTPLPNTYLANFSQIYPEDRGTNYAVRDGERIAEMVIEDLSK